jgi:hypothetical protein
VGNVGACWSSFLDQDEVAADDVTDEAWRRLVEVEEVPEVSDGEVEEVPEVHSIT